MEQFFFFFGLPLDETKTTSRMGPRKATVDFQSYSTENVATRCAQTPEGDASKTGERGH